jgi:hypothetical protein
VLFFHFVHSQPKRSFMTASLAFLYRPLIFQTIKSPVLQLVYVETIAPWYSAHLRPTASQGINHQRVNIAITVLIQYIGGPQVALEQHRQNSQFLYRQVLLAQE